MNQTNFRAKCANTSQVVSSYRAFSYSDGPRGTGPSTSINGLFLPGNLAQGQAGFLDYPGCGSASGVTWSAARR